jgi:hypothetical protein
MSPIVVYPQDTRPIAKMVLCGQLIVLAIFGAAVYSVRTLSNNDPEPVQPRTVDETGTEILSDTGDPCQKFEGQPPAEGDDITPYEECLRTSE